MDLTNTPQSDSPSTTLISIKDATQEGQLRKDYLLQMASYGQDSLEVVVYVDHKDIVGGANVPITSNESGYYLALPASVFSNLMAKGYARVDRFLLPKIYDQPDSGAGLWLLKHILKGCPSVDHSLLPRVYHQPDSGPGLWMAKRTFAMSKNRFLETREEIYIKRKQLRVVQEQAVKFYTKSIETEPCSATQKQITVMPDFSVPGDAAQPDTLKPDDYIISNEKLEGAFRWSINTIKLWANKAGVPIVKIDRKNAIKKTDILEVQAFHEKYSRE